MFTKLQLDLVPCLVFTMIEIAPAMFSGLSVTASLQCSFCYCCCCCCCFASIVSLFRFSFIVLPVFVEINVLHTNLTSLPSRLIIFRVFCFYNRFSSSLPLLLLSNCLLRTLTYISVAKLRRVVDCIGDFQLILFCAMWESMISRQKFIGFFWIFVCTVYVMPVSFENCTIFAL